MTAMTHSRPGPLPFTRSTARLCLALLGCLLVFGCAVGPDFRKPAEEAPQAWVDPAKGGDADPAVLAQWWKSFNDPVLTGLVERGIEANLDLKIAEARLRQSRAALGQAYANLFPSLDASTSYQRSRTHVGEDAAVQASDDSDTRNLYRGGFDASWEIDVFGGVRRGVEAARADLQGTNEDLRDVLVSLTGDIGVNYLTLRGQQEQLRITRENLMIQVRSAQITKKRFDAGFASNLDVSNAQAQVATTRSQIPALESQIRQTIYQLGLLLGQTPGALVSELTPEKPLPETPGQVPAGLPSELLLRRPDIRAAEARLHAATARIGVAKADLFPRFFLNGSAGIQAYDLSSWSGSVTRLWSAGPSVSWNLFNGGATRARIEENRALADQAFIEYRKAILTALQEVEKAWVAFDKEAERALSLQTAVENNGRAVELAGRLYAEGQNDFITVLDAQRSLYATQLTLTQSRTQISTQLVSLYKALGGGWEAPGTAD